MAEAQTEMYTDFWTGLEYESGSSMYRWSDETSAEYFAWGKNQPDGEYYVIFFNVGLSGPLFGLSNIFYVTNVVSYVKPFIAKLFGIIKQVGNETYRSQRMDFILRNVLGKSWVLPRLG